MSAPRTCNATTRAGEPCRQAPLSEGELCFWHAPETQEQAQEARRLGGRRRRRESTVAAAFAFEGLGSIPQIRRLLEVAVVDVLELENSIARARTLGSLAQTAARLLEVGELEARIETLEQALEHRLVASPARRR